MLRLMQAQPFGVGSFTLISVGKFRTEVKQIPVCICLLAALTCNCLFGNSSPFSGLNESQESPKRTPQIEF